MDERNVDVERIDQLLERSSLGTPGAQRLRRRTPAVQVAAARRIAHLRNSIVHPRGDHDVAAAAAELVDLLVKLGYYGQADHVLHEWFPADGGAIANLAAVALLHSARSAPQGSTRQSRDEKETGIATLTLAPASDRLAGDDPSWRDELHLLFTELHEQVGAMPVRCRPRVDDVPATMAEPPIIITMVFRYTTDSVTHLSTCLRHWLDRTPGRSLDLAVDSSTWSERIVLYSGGTWCPTVPDADEGWPGSAETTTR
ncbi:hypothetical protein [Spirilliplanes yamanashiensis]|uniref:Uncharacterized protein n=1 Tax=Spirilliplanes yamanashiensis TaxID=42233 RepID=A0A8J3YEQ7_9ACTN|nr:hypothetical protein [Spirilliplanes yamanashiensis]MDP9818517.1 hypothetical protein [Spirilliplanes yamanashiensis]GIJ06355.1 hypothetical protein Sya03_57070 [Spirilliplanes yamanashiensis]